ncbi:MAG: BREX-1 system phosphatase PglZ type A, partial [Candidatus Tantalella remota]|nr:BREX-1 system phosphatase PglZ type A [Candidatus Tantalella remota]
QFVLMGGYVRDAAVCMSEWRDSVRMTIGYDRLSRMVRDAVGIERYLLETPIDNLKDAATFFVVEKVCAGRIKEYILGHEDTLDDSYVGSLCRTRQNMHWANKRLGNDIVPREAFWSVYEALIAASEFIALKNSFPQGIGPGSVKAFFDEYKGTLYKFDRLYRIFNEHANIADAKGWGVLKELKERIEDIYQHWFLDELAFLWEEKADLQSWQMEGVVNQYDFFSTFPGKRLGDKSATVYVIVSDALRYESGLEVAEILNGRYRFKATCEAMLGCVPSYTSLGMAALLPHKRIEFSDKGDILVDGQSTGSLNYRNDIMSAYNGMAVKAEDFMNSTRDDAREMVRGKNVVFIYHNTIDAIGDDAKSEDKAFSAVRNAIDEVSDMAAFVVNNLHARYVFVTSDHGFVYTNRKPDATDRNKVPDLSKEMLKTNKRYIVGEHIPIIENIHQAKVSDTAGVVPDKDMAFAIPKGMSLFYFTGGARFFHGGMSLQEVVIPVVVIEQVSGKEKEKTRNKTVGIQVLGQDHRITTGRHRFEILQTEAVSERIKPVTYKVGIYAGSEPVSDIQTVTFDSVSEEMADRKKEVILTLKNVVFSGTESYRLVFRNANTDIDELSIPVRIDRAFTSDF